MTEAGPSFVTKLRRLIRVLMWLWVIGVFAFLLIFSVPHMPTGGTLEHPPASGASGGLDWGDILLAWALYGVAPTVVLGVVLYLMPGGKRKGR